jgi:phenylacetate-CoA ligase
LKLALSRRNLWEKLPPPLRRGIGGALSVVPVEVVLGARYRRERAFLEQAQWWPQARSREYQLGQLRRICALAAERTPYYARSFRDGGFDPRDLHAVEELRGLPLIDRRTLDEHLAEMCTSSPPRGDYVSTGGSTGAPLRFYIGAERSAFEYAHLAAGWSRAGYRPGLPLAVFRGRVVPPGAAGLRHEFDPLLRHHYYSDFHMSEGDMDRYLDQVAGLGPCFLHVYPSAAFTLAHHIRRRGRSAPVNVRGILAESEIVYEDQRRLVREVFGCRYFASYGHTELVAAAECESSTVYHVWPTYGLCELLDESGRPGTTPGQWGEIVGTGFVNTSVPFIRYRTGDFATLAGTGCRHCSREHLLLRDIRGQRVHEFLVAADGSRIAWTALNMHDDTFERVARFQLLQQQPGRAVLKVVPAAGFGAADRERILRNLEVKLGGRIDLTLELTQDVAVTPVGKAIYVDQRIPQAPAVGEPDGGRSGTVTRCRS